jgi:hypothetical protein
MGWFSKLFGGDSRDPDWEAIERLMERDAELNRTDRQGVFTGWNWNQNQDGTWGQTQSVAPGMQGGVDRLMSRSQGQGMDPYQSSPQFSQLLDARMANQMDRSGIGAQGQAPQGYGPPSNQNAGRFPAQFENPNPVPQEEWNFDAPYSPYQGQKRPEYREEGWDWFNNLLNGGRF